MRGGTYWLLLAVLLHSLVVFVADATASQSQNSIHGPPRPLRRGAPGSSSASSSGKDSEEWRHSKSDTQLDDGRESSGVQNAADNTGSNDVEQQQGAKPTHVNTTTPPPPPPSATSAGHLQPQSNENGEDGDVRRNRAHPPPPPPPRSNNNHHNNQQRASSPGDVPVSAPGLNEPAPRAIMVRDLAPPRPNHHTNVNGNEDRNSNKSDSSSDSSGHKMDYIQESKTKQELRYRPVIVGICGGTGSGKTTLTKAIVERLGASHVSLISHDSYYQDLQHLPVEERARVNFDHPAALDSRLLSKHISMLKEGIPVQCPVYDFTTHSRKLDEYARIDPSKIVLVDGILIFAEPKLLDAMDMKIFVDTADDIRFMRRLQRDVAERARTVDSICSQYHKTVRPMHKLFVEPSRRAADIIVPSCDGIQEVALDMVVSRLRELIAQHEADLEELRSRLRPQQQ